MTPSSTYDHVDGLERILSTLYFYNQRRFHDSGRRHEERTVASSSRGRDNLPTTSEKWLRGELGLDNFELDVSNGFIAERTFTGCPFKALNDCLFTTFEESLFNFWRQSIIDEYIWPVLGGSETPDATRCEEIPFIFILKELRNLLFPHSQAYIFLFDVFAKTFF